MRVRDMFDLLDLYLLKEGLIVMSKEYSSVVERFMRYVQIDTESLPDGPVAGSIEKQKVLGSLLMDELRELGAVDVRMCKAGCVYATIPANCDVEAPAVGFLAHLDTSPDVCGAGVKPHIVECYDGGSIILNEQKNIVMNPERFPDLKNYVGQDIIVTDGTTLLGADDKAGVAEIMYMAEYFHDHPEVKHGTIKVGFTTNEEIGCEGAAAFDIQGFGADFAYTVDGGAVGEYNCESFNAADARVEIHGVQVHPGEAKNKMVNAVDIASQFNHMIPSFDTCQHTEGREGYFHATDIKGDVSLTTINYLIRDFSMDGFEHRKAFLRNIASYLNGVYGEGTVEVSFEDTYFSMYEAIKPNPAITEHALKAISDCGITPVILPIRGGTDGSILSGRGLPCPNLSAGGHNCHSIYEYVPVQSLEKDAQVLITLALSFVQ